MWDRKWQILYTAFATGCSQADCGHQDSSSRLVGCVLLGPASYVSDGCAEPCATVITAELSAFRTGGCHHTCNLELQEKKQHRGYRELGVDAMFSAVQQLRLSSEPTLAVTCPAYCTALLAMTPGKIKTPCTTYQFTCIAGCKQHPIRGELGCLFKSKLSPRHQNSTWTGPVTYPLNGHLHAAWQEAALRCSPVPLHCSKGP